MDAMKEAIISALEQAFEKMKGEKIDESEETVKKELEELKKELGIYNEEFKNVVIRKENYDYTYRTSKNFIENKYVEALKIFGKDEDILYSIIYYYDENNELIKTECKKYRQQH